MARPMPRALPVTMAVLPDRSMLVLPTRYGHLRLCVSGAAFVSHAPISGQAQAPRAPLAPSLPSHLQTYVMWYHFYKDRCRDLLVIPANFSTAEVRVYGHCNSIISARHDPAGVWPPR